MEFHFLDVENLSEEVLLKVLNANSRVCHKMEQEIKKLKSGMESFVSVNEDLSHGQEINFKKNESLRDDNFEEEIDYYLTDLRTLKEENLEASIKEILPSRSNGSYSKIVWRLASEMQREINDINEIILGEEMDEEELKGFKDEIKLLEKKKEILGRSLFAQKQEHEVEMKKNNKLIFIPTNFGNPRVLDELEDIPQEYYSNFLELVESIKDGSFKGVKRFINNVTLKGACEVRGFATRIVFIRLSHDCFGLLTAFLKKADNDRGYRRSLELKMIDFNKIKDSIVEKLDDEDFILENKEIENELFALLRQNVDTEEEVLSNDASRTSR